jgi:hypothetical protein|tara:strand:+ start:3332 stop:4096 length:765 start_codon:yes stop_codon:yes gene_type:complete
MANDLDLAFGSDAIDELVKIATDSSVDDRDPGVLRQGVPGIPLGGPVRRPQFQQGGIVNGSQQPLPMGTPGATNAPRLSPEQMQAEAQRILREHPQEFLEIRNIVQRAIQNGEITMEEINLGGQLATAAVQNPQLWPQLRQFAIQKGLADEQDLPQEYDQGLVFVMLLAIQAIQGQQGAPGAIPQAQGQPPQVVGGASQAQGQPPVAGLKQGGPVPNSRNPDGSVAIIAHTGEVVIPDHVVRAKGTDFFDKLIG